MENKDYTSSEELDVQKLLGNYLHLRVSNSELAAEGEHLDEDSLSAFVEGNLGRGESQSIVSHLVDCSFCRHVTTELVKLDLAFAQEEMPQTFAVAETPSKISEVLSGVLSRIFGSTEGAVFAHQEPEENVETEREENKEDEGES